MKTITPAPQSFFSKFKSKITVSNTTQLAMGGVGALAGMLYWAPSAVCAQSEVCGLWLSNLTSEQAAQTIFFMSGAIGYSGSNAYFSSFSIPRFIDYIKKQQSTKVRLAKGVAIVGVASMGMIPIFIACEASHSEAIVTALSLIGAFPGLLYATVEMAKIEIPYFYSKIANVLSQYSLRKFFFQSEQEMQKNNFRICHRQFYARQQKIFLENLDLHLRNITLQANKLILTDEDTHPNYQSILKLSSQLNTLPASPRIEHIAQGIGKLAGLLLVANFTIPFVIATQSTLQDKLNTHDVVGTAILSTFLSSLNIYSNISVTVPATQGFLLACLSLVMDQFKNLNSMLFQLRPVFTLGAMFGVSLLTALSYAVLSVMSDQYYNGPAKGEFRNAAMFGIDYYHFFALFLFAKLMLMRFASNPSDRALLQLEQTVEDLGWMTLEQFANMTEEMSAEEQAAFGIQELKEPIENDSSREEPASNLQAVSFYKQPKLILSELTVDLEAQSQSPLQIN